MTTTAPHRGRWRTGIRGAAAGALVAALVLAAGACSSEDEDGEDEATSTTTTTLAPPSTVSDEQFETAVAGYGQLVTDAGTDPCKVADVLRQIASLPTPANQVQTEQGVGLIAQLFRAAAAAPPAGAEADAPALGATADALEAEGEQQGWDPAWLTEAPGPAAVNDQAFQSAFGNYQAKAAEQCAAATTSVP